MADASYLSEHQILIEGKLTGDIGTVRLARESDADLPIQITEVKPGAETNTYVLVTPEKLSSSDHYLLSGAGLDSALVIAPSAMTVLFSVIIGSALINNMVFTRYLGLCVFFGVSQKKETAVGMAVTFFFVGLLSGILAWGVNHIALEPLRLEFLQIIAFIGIVACLVQGTDLIVKKVNRALHKKFGIFLMLITTNCVILAVPLLNATAGASFIEALGLAIGSGAGFGLAIFLFSCARERIDMAPVPHVFQGLPVAFIVCGLFALAFLGFSGMKVM